MCMAKFYQTFILIFLVIKCHQLIENSATKFDSTFLTMAVTKYIGKSALPVHGLSSVRRSITTGIYPKSADPIAT